MMYSCCPRQHREGAGFILIICICCCRCIPSIRTMAVSPADLDQYPPEGAGGDEADLHKHVPDDIFRLVQRPGPLRDALEARAAVSNFPVQTVFSRLLAHCFIW